MLNLVATMLKKASILEKESMITLFMIFDVQLTFEEAHEYFKLHRIERLQIFLMKLNVGPSHGTSRTLKLNMVSPCST